MINRRDFLKASAAAGASIYAVGCSLEGRTSDRTRGSGAPLAPEEVDKFVDPLPIPSVLSPTRRRRGVAHYEMRMQEFSQRLHSQFTAETTVWGYNGLYPGPTIEAQVGRPISVRWINDLPDEHLFRPIPDNHGTNALYEVRSVVHLHGGIVPTSSDGYPEDWFPPGGFDTYYYPNDQRAATLWYHDHALGITRLNVMAGLAGFYILRDPSDRSLHLPSGDYEIPLVIQDRSFTADCQLDYPTELVPEFFGDVALVNGKVWPYLEVEPRKYRFRILNGSNSRFYRMAVLQSDQETTGPQIQQIGTDGGLLPSPVSFDGATNATRLLVGPGQRADVVVDFSGYGDQNLILHNNAPSPFKGDPDDTAYDLPQIMQFKVLPRARGRDVFQIPATLSAVEPIDPDGLPRRKLTLVEVPDSDPLTLLLGTLSDDFNTPAYPDGLGWDDDPVTEIVRQGDTEIWELYNLTVDTHPIHLHMVEFQILNRQPLVRQGEEYLPEVVADSTPTRRPGEEGWHDIVLAGPGEVTRIIVPFDTFEGRAVWHCHILEHEDNEMMRPMRIISNS